MSSLSFRALVWRAVAACALIGGVAVEGAAVRAQGIGTPGMLGMQGVAPSFSGEQLDRSLRGRRPPPSALPGTGRKTEPIAPPSQVPTLMSPTDALFDAVNRGDMAGVRDAISRGADLSTTNELGLTPLDLAIDLGRSDISFLLLSMRAAGPVGGAGQQQAAQPLPPAKPREASGPARSKVARQPVARATVEATEQTSLPQLFARNGGQPIPAAGFLGFDGR